MKRIMTLRRSQRNITSKIETVKTEIKPEPVPVVKKEEEEEGSMLSTLATPKPSPQPSSAITRPKHWDIVYDTLEAYREKETAPVDTMGCERLAQKDAPPIVQRFQTLVALMLSSQTKDTVTSVAVWKLQSELPGGLNLESILNVEEATLDKMISTVGFHTKKASYIKKTAAILRDQYGGDIPDTIEGLVGLPGVGPKMGYLTLQVAWNKNVGIGVDVHVHRITNRLGWVKTKTPEETREKLQSWLPKDKWKKINPIMVGYGQIVCLPRGPRCDICPSINTVLPLKPKKSSETTTTRNEKQRKKWLNLSISKKKNLRMHRLRWTGSQLK